MIAVVWRWYSRRTSNDESQGAFTRLLLCASSPTAVRTSQHICSIYSCNNPPLVQAAVLTLTAFFHFCIYMHCNINLCMCLYLPSFIFASATHDSRVGRRSQPNNIGREKVKVNEIVCRFLENPVRSFCTF